MALDPRLLREVRALDDHELRRLMIVVRGRLQHRPGPEFRPEPEEAHVTYRLEPVRCGKEGCRSCPHGPYWYAYWREHGRLRSRYIGKDRPEGARETGAAGETVETGDAP
ncbi:MAG: hypothetical protein JWL73_2654 [Actinomycetia bacterium]|nr:hypothetical protein [Actinomycetes bacterium]